MNEHFEYFKTKEDCVKFIVFSNRTDVKDLKDYNDFIDLFISVQNKMEKLYKEELDFQ